MNRTIVAGLRLLQRAHGESSERLFAGRITGSQLRVLAAIAAAPRSDQRSVTDVTFIDRSTVAAVVATLVERGWVVSERSDVDGRRDSLTASPRGAAIAYEISPELVARNASLLSPLDPAARAVFIERLSALAFADRDVPPVDFVLPSPEPGGPVVVVRWGLGRLLRGALQRHARLWAERYGSLVTPVQFLVLDALAHREPVAQNRLGDDVAVDKATMAETLRRLGRRGYVTKQPDPDDARRRLIRATPAGGAVLAGVRALLPPLEEAFLAPLAPAAAEGFRDQLGTVTSRAAIPG